MARARAARFRSHCSFARRADRHARNVIICGVPASRDPKASATLGVLIHPPELLRLSPFVAAVVLACSGGTAENNPDGSGTGGTAAPASGGAPGAGVPATGGTGGSAPAAGTG